MIKLENYEVMGFAHAIRGMRNPMNSWSKSDSDYCFELDSCDGCPMHEYDEATNHEKCNLPPSGRDKDGNSFSSDFVIGPNDHELMMKLAKGGAVHAKYRRMITVYVDITAPLYWWKEFDTYKVGTVANSCSTMHKIHSRDLTLEDFSVEHLDERGVGLMQDVIDAINLHREGYTLATGDKEEWYKMIQLLPTSYNQKRTVMMNYEVLTNIYETRKNHKLDEWHKLCEWIESLTYSEVITGQAENAESGDGVKEEK